MSSYRNRQYTHRWNLQNILSHVRKSLNRFNLIQIHNSLLIILTSMVSLITLRSKYLSGNVSDILSNNIFVSKYNKELCVSPSQSRYQLSMFLNPDISCQCFLIQISVVNVSQSRYQLSMFLNPDISCQCFLIQISVVNVS